MNHNITPGISVPQTNNDRESLQIVQNLISKSARRYDDDEHELLSEVLACYFEEECAVDQLSDLISDPEFTEKEAEELVREAFELAVAHLELT